MISTRFADVARFNRARPLDISVNAATVRRQHGQALALHDAGRSKPQAAMIAPAAHVGRRASGRGLVAKKAGLPHAFTFGVGSVCAPHLWQRLNVPVRQPLSGL